jgi:2,3-bisphosphoglycerate-dependent phosphoglycerate mutase
MKVIYFIRHSKPGNCSFIYRNSNIQIKNEMKKLTKEGKSFAKKLFSDKEFDCIEEIYSSNYLRAYQTAKILAKRLDLKVKILPEFGERKVGIKSWDEYPKDFEIHQFNDNNYKLENGESLNEVRERELKALNSILTQSKADNIAIVFHSTAMMTLLKTWCNVSYDSDYYFNNKIFFNGKWNYCETFKLTFNDNNDLIEIKNIKL